MKFELSMDYLQYFSEERLVPFGLQLLTAVVVFYVGRMIARLLRRTLERLTADRLDAGLQRFVCSIAYAFMLTIVVIASLERMGVRTTAAVAILGAAGLAVGLALQGSLSNFASGVMLLIFRPFVVGDLVDVGGIVGVVEKIDVFTTVLITPDGKTVIMPNGQAAGGCITNLSKGGTLRVDMEVGVSYGDDLARAKQVIEQALVTDPRVLQSPAPTVAVGNLGASSVDFVVRPWCKVEHYWSVRFDAIQRVKEALDAAGISIPFPQQDLHVKQLPRAA